MKKNLESQFEVFQPEIEGPEQVNGESLIFAFRERRLLVRANGRKLEVPTQAEFDAMAQASEGTFSWTRRQYLGRLGERSIFSAELPENLEAPDGHDFQGLRRLFFQLEEEMIGVASRAVQVVEWDRDHQFCSRCGAVTEQTPGERAKRCPRCRLTQYPRLAPAVIVLVERHRSGFPPEALLARSPHFPPGMFSTLAGFVEPGENLEQTVQREIFEETGIEVDEIDYFGSQPWPFPHSLMIGFTARYAGGVLNIDGEEIVEAGWFTADRLPQIPPRISIARRLIDAFIERQDASGDVR